MHADLSEVYPFFRFTPTQEDPYTFPLTFTASCAIWVSPIRPLPHMAKLFPHTSDPTSYLSFDLIQSRDLNS
jgi:hypothetical protein